MLGRLPYNSPAPESGNADFPVLPAGSGVRCDADAAWHGHAFPCSLTPMVLEMLRWGFSYHGTPDQRGINKVILLASRLTSVLGT